MTKEDNDIQHNLLFNCDQVGNCYLNQIMIVGKENKYENKFESL